MSNQTRRTEDERVRRCERALIEATCSALAHSAARKPLSEAATAIASALDGVLRVRLPELEEARAYGSPDGAERGLQRIAPDARRVRLGEEAVAEWLFEVERS